MRYGSTNYETYNEIIKPKILKQHHEYDKLGAAC